MIATQHNREGNHTPILPCLIDMTLTENSFENDSYKNCHISGDAMDVEMKDSRYEGHSDFEF